MLRLAHADRTMEKAIAAGSAPPEMRQLWNRLENRGVEVRLFDRGGAGYLEGAGFHRTLERMHARGWRVEILSWADSTNRRMREWAEANGVFVPLDDFYEAVTFMEPSLPGHELAQPRDAAALDLGRRHVSPPACPLI